MPFFDECRAAVRAIQARQRRPYTPPPVLAPTRTGSGPCPSCDSMDVMVTAAGVLTCLTCNMDIKSYD